MTESRTEAASSAVDTDPRCDFCERRFIRIASGVAVCAHHLGNASGDRVGGRNDRTEARPLRVGAEVRFRENDEHPDVLGVVWRLWPNGRYVTVRSDGRTFVRLIERVTVCA